MVSFKQGEGVLLEILVDDSPAVDFSLAEDIHVILFVGTTELKKYSLNAKTGYGDLTVKGSPDTDTLKVVIEREHSIEFPVGLLSANIIATFTDASFADGVKPEVWDIRAARVTAGRALDDEMP